MENDCRQHCKLSYNVEQAAYVVEDLGTRNGTFVNDTQIEDVRRRHVLCSQ